MDEETFKSTVIEDAVKLEWGLVKNFSISELLKLQNTSLSATIIN